MADMSRWVNGEIVVVSQEEIDAIMAAPVAQADLLALAADARWRVMVGGLLFDGFAISTDDVGRGLVTGAYTKAKSDPSVTKLWQVANSPITFQSFSNAQLVALGDAVDGLVQGAFDVLAQVTQDIASGKVTTKQQVFDAFAQVPRAYTTPST